MPHPQGANPLQRRVGHGSERRRFTEGASAIRSAQDKRFEAACGRPDRARLGSEAFGNVRGVRAAVLAVQDQDSLCAAYRERRDRLRPEDRLAPDRALHALEDSQQRWKSAHRGLTVRMLGTAPGSGYTAGVPYLQGCLANRLFPPLHAA
ncbi:hypothetical protein GCM10023215_37160 [Pseudonocardia yuanmonensis]|uniref:Lysozyme inhibitor LprI N-terminal domain-containing protein n=1 Tax=Pseudonocardia yuanmonensis TaxID=1095914 RepID=A0ABP8WYR0_9PSEU